MPNFKLDPMLISSTHFVTDLHLCRVLFKDDMNFPSVVLVPRHPNLREIVDLSANNRSQLIQEIAMVSKVIQNIYSPFKLNVASLGNQVAQLHVHVIARHKEDIAWPNATFGIPPVSYTPDALEEHLKELKWRFSEGYTQRLKAE